jgi:hypothetical protein
LEFLIKHGAHVNKPLPDTGETPLHAALGTTERVAHDLVVEVLLARGANPEAVRGSAEGATLEHFHSVLAPRPGCEELFNHLPGVSRVALHTWLNSEHRFAVLTRTKFSLDVKTYFSSQLDLISRASQL